MAMCERPSPSVAAISLIERGVRDAGHPPSRGQAAASASSERAESGRQKKSRASARAGCALSTGASSMITLRIRSAESEGGSRRQCVPRVRFAAHSRPRGSTDTRASPSRDMRARLLEMQMRRNALCCCGESTCHLHHATDTRTPIREWPIIRLCPEPTSSGLE